MQKICEGCGKLKEHHALGLCKDCYQREYPGRRPIGFCLHPEHEGADLVTIWARSLCHTCYCREQQRGTLDHWPKTAHYREPT